MWFVLVAALVVAAIEPASAEAAPTRLCADDARARCGFVRVPLHRAQPAGPKLTVRFRVFGRTDRSRPALEPIVAAEGGPGYGSIGSADGYLFMVRPLRARRDVIVMDNRGTGASGAIDCPRLQAGEGSYVREVGRCARSLGAAADAYGTGAAADDLAAVLDKLGVARVNLYGDSYGTYFAQAFAVRHPSRVRSVVLDAAFALDGYDPWAREQIRALQFAWRAVCERSAACAEDPLAVMRRAALALDVRPLTGVARDADGVEQRVRLDGPGIAAFAADGSFYYTVYRDLLAAIRANEAGDAAPLLRLAAEAKSGNALGTDVTAYSEGAYVAVACHDYPTVWTVSSSPARRRDELAAARAALPADAFAPFDTALWLRTPIEHQLVAGCLEWPAPRFPDPPAPPGVGYPDVPVLVLDGDLDSITPPEDSARAARLFPNSRLILVGNVGHVTALGDFDRCGSRLVRRFIETLDAGPATCADTIQELHVVPVFPRRVADAPQPAARPGDRSDATDRRAAWVAARAAGDALGRWWLMYGARGHGLRGGTFVASGAYYSYEPVELALDGVRFAGDLAVSGRVTWDRRAQHVRARLRVRGARDGVLRMSWPSRARHAVATIVGELGGRQTRLVTPAP